MTVEFDNQGGAYSQQFADNDTTPKLVKLLMKWGMADSEEKANKILLGIAVVAFLLTAFVIFKFVL